MARRDLARRPRFDELSPEVGSLDAEAAEQAVRDDPDETLSLLVDMAAATDDGLRVLAARLAGRVLVEMARAGSESRRGVGRLRATTGSAEGDVDLDRSIEAVAAARATRRPVGLDEIVTRHWERHDTAVCLVVDRSGSMAGRRLATAALAAAVVAVRYGDAAAVVAFADEAVVIDRFEEHRSPEDVVGDLLRLRGSGTTDVALGIRAAVGQLAAAGAARRVALVLSDCRSNTGADASDAVRAALGEIEVVLLAPADDLDDANRLAAVTGAKLTTLAGPADVPDAITMALAP